MMPILPWQPSQQSALQLLGYKRFLLRRDILAIQQQQLAKPIAYAALHAPVAPPAPLAPPPMANLAPSVADVPPPNLTPPSAPPLSQHTTEAVEVVPEVAVPVHSDAGYLALSRKASLFHSEALQCDWLFPPLTGFIGQLRLFYTPEEATLLQHALQRVDWAEEATALSALWSLPMPERLTGTMLDIPPASLPKTLVIVGQNALRYYEQHLRTTYPRSHYLPHPNQACHEGQAKKALWQALNHLKENL